MSVKPEGQIYDSHAPNISNVGVPGKGPGENTGKFVLGVKSLLSGDFKFEKNMPWEWDIYVNEVLVAAGWYDHDKGHQQKVHIEKAWVGNFIIYDPEKLEYGPKFNPDQPKKHFQAEFIKLGFRFQNKLANTKIKILAKHFYSDSNDDLYCAVFQKIYDGKNGIKIDAGHGIISCGHTELIHFEKFETDIDNDTDCSEYVKKIKALELANGILTGINKELNVKIEKLEEKMENSFVDIWKTTWKVLLNIIDDWKTKKGILPIAWNVLNSIMWLLNPAILILIIIIIAIT